MAEKEFLEVVAFVKDYKDKVHPVNCGYAYVHENGSIRVTLRSIPAGNGWDSSLVIQKKLANNASTKEDPTIPF